MENTNKVKESNEKKESNLIELVGELVDLLFVPSSLIRFAKKINKSGEGSKLYYASASCLEILRLSGYYELSKLYFN